MTQKYTYLRNIMPKRGEENMQKKYMDTREASERWGLSVSYISYLCRNGGIKGAEQDAKGRPWRIPVDAENPKKTI